MSQSEKVSVLINVRESTETSTLKYDVKTTVEETAKQRPGRSSRLFYIPVAGNSEIQELKSVLQEKKFLAAEFHLLSVPVYVPRSKEIASDNSKKQEGAKGSTISSAALEHYRENTYIISLGQLVANADLAGGFNLAEAGGWAHVLDELEKSNISISNNSAGDHSQLVVNSEVEGDINFNKSHHSILGTLKDFLDDYSDDFNIGSFIEQASEDLDVDEEQLTLALQQAVFAFKRKREENERRKILEMQTSISQLQVQLENLVGILGRASIQLGSGDAHTVASFDKTSNSNSSGAEDMELGNSM